MIAFDTDVLTEILPGDVAFVARARRGRSLMSKDDTV